MTKIKILIYTDDMDEWHDKILNDINVVCRSKSRMDGYKIKSNLFYFEIMSRYSETMRGKKFNCVVLDKYVDGETFRRIKMSAFDNLVKTEKYWTEEVVLSMM